MYVWGNINPQNEMKSNQIGISGVQGKSNPIFVEFKNIIPEGSKLFPTGNLIDEITVEENSHQEKLEATLICGANNQVIITPESLGLKGHELPKDIDYEKIKSKIYRISIKAAKLMNIPLNESLRISWVANPVSYIDTSGNYIENNSIDILSRITAGNRIHHAHTGTGAINLGIISSIEGTIVNKVLKKNKNYNNKQNNQLRIGHPGGIMACESEVVFNEFSKNWEVKRAGFIRTARLIMDGFVYY